MITKRIFLTIIAAASTQVATAQVQTVQDDETFMYETKNYPTAAQMYNAVKAKTATSKALKKGTQYRVVGLAEDTALWCSATKIELEKKHRQGWMVTSKVQDRTSLIPYVSDFRSAYRTNALLRRLAPGMNRDEVFVCSNIRFPKEQEQPAPWNKAYTMWGDAGNFLLFYHDSLCTSQVTSQYMFYYRPHYTIQLVGAECNLPVANQNVKESSYWDENMEINWALDTHTLNFAMENRSRATLHLLWDDMVMMGEKSQRVIHNGTNFEQRFNEQTNSVVARGTTFSDALLPIQRITFDERKGWMCPPLVDNYVFSPSDTTGINRLKGQEIKVLFVMTRDNLKFEYTFTFRITDVTYSLEQGSMDQQYLLAVSKQ